MKRTIGALGIVLGGLTAGCDRVETAMALVTGSDEAPGAAAEADTDTGTGTASGPAQEKASGQRVAIDSNVPEPTATPAEPAVVAQKSLVSTAGKDEQVTAAAQAGKLAEQQGASGAGKAQTAAEPVAKLDAKQPATEPQDKVESPVKDDSKPTPGERQQRPRVRTGTTFASGEVDATAAHRALRSAHGSLRACYDRALKDDPESNGTINVAVQIGAGGQVTGAKSNGAPGLPGHVTQCAVGVVRGLTFPLKDGSKSGTLSVPVTFTPG